MNVLIVHNDETYGGAGYPSEGAATVSTNSLSPLIGIHELGHSLFGLADEYTYGDGNPDQDANCDNAGCSKWSDLIQAGLASCSSGKCRDGSYYSSGTNMMENYDVHSFGPVNQRITCCKYLYHTGVAPGYCSQFNDIGVGLSQYCNGQLWQGRYTNLNLLQHKHFQAPANSTAKNATTYMLEMAEDTQGDQYAFVEEPVAWILKYVPPEGDGDGNRLDVAQHLFRPRVETKLSEGVLAGQRPERESFRPRPSRRVSAIRCWVYQLSDSSASASFRSVWLDAFTDVLQSMPAAIKYATASVHNAKAHMVLRTRLTPCVFKNQSFPQSLGPSWQLQCAMR